MLPSKQLGILILLPGSVPLAKGHVGDNEHGREWQYETVVGLRKHHPTSVIVPYTITEGGDLWPEAESEFLHKWSVTHS